MKRLNLNKSKSYFLSCDYNEDKPSEYQGYKLATLSKVVKTFNSGDPVKDWGEMKKFVTDQGLFVLFTSSVDHFVFDSKKYIWNDQGDLARKPLKKKKQ